ncbi:MAG: hypothetical protein DMF08_10300 [Verrucomicrobia bacterium]|nr:MAG: hypothetical protein DMF08_10300 [Verrucomicrobiota bacterium]PYI82270.1 MAG: hypothetical protein DMF05_00135 [Verrucomicrobiota bacterium]
MIFPANSNGSAKAAAGIARTDYAGHSFPDGAYFGTHRVSRNAESGLPCSYSTATESSTSPNFLPGFFRYEL